MKNNDYKKIVEDKVILDKVRIITYHLPLKVLIQNTKSRKRKERRWRV